MGWAIHFKQESRNPFFLWILICTPIIYATIEYFLFRGGKDGQTLAAAAIGSTQVGSSASGMRKPQIVQTGNSNRFPTIHAARKRTKADPIRKPSIPIEKIVGGIATTNASQFSTEIGTPKRKRT